MKHLNVLLVLDSLALGGTETHVLSLAKYLKRQGAKVVIAGDRGAMFDTFKSMFPTHPIPFWGEGVGNDTVSKVKELMLEENINILHVHQTPSGLLASSVAKELGVPIVMTVHGTYYPAGELSSLLQHTGAVISVSKPVQSYVAKAGFSSEVIPNGIDFAEFSSRIDGRQVRKRLGVPEDATVLLYASRMAWQKATICKMAMRAVRDLRRSVHPHLEILVVGDGPQFAEVEDLAKRLETSIGQRFIHIAGRRGDLPNYYAASDAVIGTGRVALEAMACGKPVLAAGNHGFFGWVEPSVYDQAWDCYFGDHLSLRSCSLQLLTESLRKKLSDKGRLGELGAHGRSWAEGRFEVKHIGRLTSAVYESLLSVEKGVP